MQFCNRILRIHKIAFGVLVTMEVRIMCYHMIHSVVVVFRWNGLYEKELTILKGETRNYLIEKKSL